VTIFFTSDLHIGHDRINELAGRPFDSVNEMNNAIVDNWNARVGRDDVVWVLGDVAMGHINDSLRFIERLNGSKHLVPGNHDRCFSQYRKNGPREADFELYRAVGFKVHPEYVQFAATSRARGVEVWNLCHFPYTGDSGDVDRYADLRPRDTGQILLHGHIHRMQKIRGRQVHVGVDAWDFAPASLDEIVELLDKEGV
jgi:calcineurin-like phosphoesterase family protein